MSGGAGVAKKAATGEAVSVGPVVSGWAPGAALADEPLPGMERVVLKNVVRALAARRCATCGATIGAGETYRQDTWADVIFGEVLSSAICRECQAEGL
jgi:hypothetical protein